MTKESLAEIAERETVKDEQTEGDEQTDAEEEAADAEAQPAQEPEDEPEHTGESHAPSPGSSPGADALDMEQVAELTKAQELYSKRVRKVFGDKPPPDCPACMGLGVDLSYGGAEPDFLEDPTTAECPVCASLGSVKSRSKVAGQELNPCPRCKGAGYLVIREVPIENAALVAPVVAALDTGTGNADQLVRVGPGEPGWEPWMGDPNAANGPTPVQPTYRG